MTTIWDNNNSYSAESKAREDYDLETGKFDYEKEYLDAMAGKYSWEQVQDLKERLMEDVGVIEDDIIVDSTLPKEPVPVTVRSPLTSRSSVTVIKVPEPVDRS